MGTAGKRPKIIGRDFILTWIVSLLSGMCMRMLDSTLASYAAYAWDSMSLGGYLTTFFTIGSVVMAFFSGRLNNRKGRKNCLMIGCLLYAAPAFLMAFVQIPEAVLACRLVQGCAKGLIMVSSAAIIADVVPHDYMNRGMGIYGVAVTLSYAFGPMLGLAIVGEDNHYLWMFAVCGIFYLVSALSCVGINYEKKRRMAAAQTKDSQTGVNGRDENKTEAQTAGPAAEAGAPKRTEYKGIWKLIEKNAILPSLNFMICISSYACIVVFVTVYAQDMLDLNGTKLSLFFTAAAIAMLVVRLVCSKWADRYGAMILLLPGHLSIIFALLILAFWAKYSYALFLVAGVLYGIGNSACFPGLNTVAVVDSPPERSGEANAAYYFMMDIGMLVASAIFGVYLDAAPSPADGYLGMFLISIGIAVCSTVMTLVLFNNKSRAKRNPRFAEHMEKVRRGELDV